MSLPERRPFKSLGLALNAGYSLLDENTAVDVYKPVYEAIAHSEHRLPLNREDQILPEFLRIVAERDIKYNDALRPYWAPEKSYNPREIFGTLVQLVDYHNSPLSDAALPPEEDVKEYIHKVMNIKGRVTLPQQFETLLDVTRNDLIGAIQLGAIASRVMARGLDTRAYPNIAAGKDEMFAWNDKIAQFERHIDSDKNDGPGDTYYFWTHMFAALFYKQYEGLGRELYNASFAHGTEIMKLARKWIARSPINSDHHEATLIGRAIGLAFVEQQKESKELSKEESRGRAKILFDYLFTNKEYTVYENPDLYDESALNKWYRRDNLARGVADVVEENLPRSNNKILELGAGTGILSLELAKRGFNVIAVDLFSEPLHKLQKKAAIEDLHSQPITVQADMNDSFPFQDSSFSSVVSLRATRYITDFDYWLGEVNRVLQPTGTLILPVFMVDTIPWKRHSNKGFFQETSTSGMRKSIMNAGFEIDNDASVKYTRGVKFDDGKRDVPFYYKPTFIVARKTVNNN